MNNTDFIRQYITGKKKFGAYGHLGCANDTLFNYSTEICQIDRENKTAKVNVKKYSRTTSKIQTELKFLLSQYGYAVTEYEGKSATMWNCGYQGARTLTTADMRGK